MLWQPSLNERYTKADSKDLQRDITDRRQRLGDKLVILGHHYQTDAVVRHADLTGDSLKLSQLAAKVCEEKPVEHLVFCGVHFMAESADILSPDHVSVSLPDLSAGCSMADMAQYDDCVYAWDAIHRELESQGFQGRVIPITYVNSSAAIKAFVGAHGGSCCTSSNADTVFEWAANGGDGSPDDDIKILFLPDQHLGRNTAHKFGIDTEAHTIALRPQARRPGSAARRDDARPTPRGKGHPLGGPLLGAQALSARACRPDPSAHRDRNRSRAVERDRAPRVQQRSRRQGRLLRLDRVHHPA